MAKKPKKNHLWSPRNKKVTAILGVLLLALILVFIFRGWFRVTVIPKTVGVFHLSGVNDTLSKESSNLDNPFTTLGFVTPKTTKACKLQQAQSFHTEIDCSVSQHDYIKLPSSTTGVANVQEQASKLEKLLISNGWAGGSNGVTLTSLVDGTAKGIDYSPDAFYQKVVGTTDCVFDTMIAYSNPQPPAISATFSCDRTINILGSPKQEVFNSSKGL